MEVLYRNQPVFGAQPAAMVYPSPGYSSLSPHLFSSPAQAYTCYSFEASPASSSASSSVRSPHAPSRTPTPEHPSSSLGRPSDSPTSSSAMSHGTTLQSVLRGEVPEAYSHFLSASPPRGSDHSPSSVRLPHHHHHHHNNNHHHHHHHNPHHHHHHPGSPAAKRLSPFAAPQPEEAMEGVLSSPPPLELAVDRGSATVLSPPPEDVQTEPMDLSFKRPSSASSGASSPASFHHTFPPSPAEDLQGQASEFSLLRNLLQVGKVPAQPAAPALNPPNTFPPSSSPSTSDRSCDSPCSDSGLLPTRHLCGSTRVTLAKKNMYPVSARVSDWLLKVVQFANSIEQFRRDVSHADQLTLVLNSWSRLLLLFMAESNFQFAVTPLRSEPQASEGGDGGPSPDEPTMKSVEGVQTFIRKCQHMGVEADEYYYLRMLVLFNSSYVGLSEPSKVDGFNSHIQQLLQQHVQHTRPSDIMHYSRLLMCLPSLYGISAKMVEKLFCRHIDSNSATDMEVLLKELLQTCSSSS